MRLNRSMMPLVIPALRDPEHWRMLGEGRGRWVFILGGKVDRVAEGVALLQKRQWRVFVHIDMVKGITNDSEGVQFFYDFAGPEGIITTHAHTVTHAHKLGMVTIQRIFLLDSQSVESGVAQVEHAGPDAVEVLPGILPEVVRALVHRLKEPVIAGGLITSVSHIHEIHAAGALSVSTSSLKLIDAIMDPPNQFPAIM